MECRKHEPSYRTKGFTLVELVMIIVITSVLGVVVLTRHHQPNETAVSIEADHLARDIRHMQILAMTWGQTLRLTAAGSSYDVRCVTAGAPPCNLTPVVDPAIGAAFTRSLNTLESSVSVAGATLDIDTFGRPVGAGGVLLNADRTYTLTGGTRTSTVTVARLTGFVSVVY